MPSKLKGKVPQADLVQALSRGLLSLTIKTAGVQPKVHATFVEPLSYRLATAAQVCDLSEPYLRKAIEEGRLKATVKKQPGKGRGVVLIAANELKRFVETDENAEMAVG